MLILYDPSLKYAHLAGSRGRRWREKGGFHSLVIHRVTWRITEWQFSSMECYTNLFLSYTYGIFGRHSDTQCIACDATRTFLNYNA